MQYQIHNITEENKQEAENYFDGIFDMKYQSLVARFYVGKIIEEIIGRKLKTEEKYLLETYTSGNEGIVLDDQKIYFGLSHKDDIVCVSVNDAKVAVDLEILKMRFQSVLDTFSESEYAIFGERRWVEFYIMWTAKEALIKYLGLNLDNMGDIKIEKAQEENVCVGDQKFDLKLSLYYDEVNYGVFSGRDGNTFYSLLS